MTRHTPRCLLLAVFFCTLSFPCYSSSIESVQDIGLSSVNKDSESPIALANLDAEPSALVHGCVNVITGQLSLSDTDLVVPHGVNPVSLSRNYAGIAYHAGTLCPGWNLSHFSFESSAGKHDEGDYVVLLDNGAKLPFKKSKYSERYRLTSESLKKSVTNNASGYICGQTNIKNSILTKDKDTHYLRLGDGTVKTYDYISKDQLSSRRLKSEEYPNGNKLVYEFSRLHKRLYLSVVSLKNSADKEVATLNFDTKKLKPSPDGVFYTVKAQDGRYAKYELVEIKDYGMNVLKSVETSDKPLQKYDYHFEGNKNDAFALLTSIAKPEKRSLGINYFQYGTNQTPTHHMYLSDRSDPRIRRVKALSAPVGTDDTLISIYQFIYDLRVEKDKKHPDRKNVLNGSCEVYNALGHRVQYVFNEDHRLDVVQRFNKYNHLYTREIMQWGDEKSQDKTNLLAHALHHVDQEVVFVRTYEYDRVGNVTTNKLYGNLTGESSKNLPLPEKGKMPEGPYECYKQTFTYSDDGLNLLLEESDGIKKTKNVYAPNTSRLIAKFIGSQDKWHQRHFYTYNADAAVIKEIVDDGSSENESDLTDVTERHITNITQSEIYPVALPLLIEEKCLNLEKGTEELVHRVLNVYNVTGKMTHQYHYGSDNKMAYTLAWDYDLMGNVITETNPLGQTIYRKYDANKNCILEQGPNPDLHKVFAYDYMNRLIREEVVHSNGMRQVVTHRYDLGGRRVATVDHLGNETQYAYDPHGRLTHIISPQVLDEAGNPYQPMIVRDHDPMGNIITETDPSGCTTERRYTLRGQIAEIKHPDGTLESYTYSLSGALTKHVAANGATTLYQNDYQGRPVKVSLFDANGTLYSETSTTYTGFHIASEVDAKGIETLYSYYPDGKLKEKRKGDAYTKYEYDVLGRNNKTYEYFGEDESDYILKVKNYDLLNRVLEERIEDATGNIQKKIVNTYDIAGNLTTMTTYPNNIPATTSSIYNSQGVAEIVRDPLGNTTYTKLIDNHINNLGQAVYRTEIIDPEGIKTVTIKDALGRDVERQIIDVLGNVLRVEKYFYTKHGDVGKVEEEIYSQGEEVKVLTTLMEFDYLGRITALIEAAGAPEQKITHYKYNSFSQKEKIIKNDGTVLTHKYDLLGRLESLKSSDNSVDYEYSYDVNGNVVSVVDKVHGTTTLKHYDQHDRLIEEVLGNGLSIKYESDSLSRTKKVELHDKTSIKYLYEGSHLKAIERYKGNEFQYRHQYEAYDLAGKLLQSSLIGSCGRLTCEYDLIGRETNVQHDKWKETIDSYDKAGNILETTVCGKTTKYQYDSLYQVIGEEGESSHSYAYDTAYNRIEKDGIVSEYNALNQLVKQGDNKYQYDLNGNLVLKVDERDGRTFKYKYDALDRLIAYEGNALKVVYTYDENNRRLTKSVTDPQKVVKKVRYLYQGQNEIGSCDEKGTVVEFRVLGIGRGAEIGAAVAIERSGKVYAPLHDHVGSVVCLLDSKTGSKAAEYAYTAFGEPLFNHHDLPWGYCSKRYDCESGLNYFGRRYYDASLGRWVTPDPIGREGGPNLYAYVLNRPLTQVDLYGLEAQSSSGGGFWGWLGQGLSSFMDRAWRVPGQIIQQVGFHLSPIPQVQTAIDFIGHCLQGGNPSTFVPLAEKEKFEIIVHEGTPPKDPRDSFWYCSGIGNLYKDVQKGAAECSKYHGGVTVYGIHMPTLGFVRDILEVFYQKLGIKTEYQRKTHEAIHNHLDTLGAHKQSARIIMDAHSRGCEVVNNMCPQLKKIMDVHAYGPAHILDPKEFKSAVNIVTYTDVIPYIADPLGVVMGVIRGSINFVIPKGSIISCHNFGGDSYASSRRHYGNQRQLRYLN